MKVCGLSRSTCSRPSLPSAARPWKRLRQAGKPWVAAMVSAAMKPTLCRLKAYSAPGLPRPTKSFISHPDRKNGGGRRSFLSGAADDGRHGEIALGDGGLHAFGQLDRRDVHAVADLETGQIHIEMLGDGVGRAADRNFVAHDVQDAAALDAGGGGFVQEAHRNLDGDQRMLAHAHEIDMDGKVANGVELHLAGNDARLGSIQVEYEDRALKVTGVELLRDGPVVHVDDLRRRLVAIEDSGNAPLAARRPGAAFAGARPRPGLEFQHLSH